MYRKKEIYNLIKLSVKEGNTQSFKKELDIAAYGKKRDYYKIARYRNGGKDEKYNLD